MTHVFALGELLGRPGAAELVAHGLDSLRHDFRDPVHGGWFAQVGGSDDKRAYEHVFVVLAAATAGDDELLGEALEVLEARFWDERAGALVDVWNRDWSELEAYRGANANMHGVEAMLATGDPLWRERAGRVTQRLVVENHPRLNEHFDADWRPLPDYNSAEPAHPFRPYGATIGHWFEWARLAYTLDPARFEADARRLFVAGVQDGWDGSGFVYTVDWDGKPVVRRSAALGAVRGDRRRRGAGGARAAGRVVGGRRARLHRPVRRLLAARARPVQPARAARLGRQAGRLPRAAGDADPALPAAQLAGREPAGPVSRRGARRPAVREALRPPGLSRRRSRPSAAASSPPP